MNNCSTSNVLLLNTLMFLFRAMALFHGADIAELIACWT